MTTRIAVVAIVTSLLGTTAAWSAPANERQIVNSQSQVKAKATIRQAAVWNYKAGYRKGLNRNVVSNRAAYNRGYSDGFDNSELIPSSQYQGENTRYIGGLATLFNPDADYRNDYGNYDARYRGENGSFRVIDASASRFYQARQRMAYCTQRYQSFDAASGTFLANDGNRYNCL